MKFEKSPSQIGASQEQPALSMGQRKINEYVGRILGGESKDSIFQGLPKSFIMGIEEGLAQSVEERKKLSGFMAGYELAKIAKQQGLDLAALSREQYADFAIQNFLTIEGTQLRRPSWHRMCESAKEIVAKNKKIRASIGEEAVKAFGRFCFKIQKKAGEDDRFIQERIRVRQETKNSNSWLFFKVNNGVIKDSKEIFKAYVSVKDLKALTPEKFISLMVALRDAGYNGDVKIFQDLEVQGVNLNDQIVMHGASENDAKLALNVAVNFFGDNLDQKSFGKDEMVNGENQSYSEILAKKIKDAIHPPKRV